MNGTATTVIEETGTRARLLEWQEFRRDQYELLQAGNHPNQFWRGGHWRDLEASQNAYQHLADLDLEMKRALRQGDALAYLAALRQGEDKMPCAREARLAREKALHVYQSALERGDSQTCERIRQQAQGDVELQRIINEAHAEQEPAQEVADAHR